MGIFCWRNIHFNVATLVWILFPVGFSYHLVRHNILQRNVVLLYDGQQVFYSAGNLLGRQGCYQRIALKFNAYRVIVAMLQAVQYGKTSMESDNGRIGHNIACAVCVNYHMGAHPPLWR